MNQAVRVVKKLAKRHHLHLTLHAEAEVWLAPHSLLVNTHSHELIQARGVADQTEICLSIRSFSHNGHEQMLSLVSAALPSALNFVALGEQAPAGLTAAVRQLHLDWTEYASRSHLLYVGPVFTEEHLNQLKALLDHLPAELNLEIVDQYLTLFIQPPIERETELESTLRLALELTSLFVAA